MVKNCSLSHYPNENEEKYKTDFEKYPFELSIFQKYAIEAINEGHHVLVLAHTGTGKTLPAEHAIEHFVSKGKKVIYTGPIKSLINQKFYDFTHKFTHISFGILTGDIKFNPEADVLIMTAEILLNKLYQNKNNISNKSALDFDMDFDNELACVVMDEVHFINEHDRGFVWENTLMMLPQHIQLVMLSATIDQPEKFANWCENLHKNNKQVYLTNTTHRVVPLTHYSFITATQGVFKYINDKTIQSEIKSIIDKPQVIQSSNGRFNDENYTKMNKVLKLFENNNIRISRPHVLNKVTEYLVQNEMLPALCFVLSRKQLKICAKEVTTNLFEFDSKVPYIIDRECEQIIRSKLSNYEEYLHLPEYINMVSLLRKGIAIHHGGVLPVLKEIVELLYAKGYIKLLFATETFSIGVNMPTKCVLFTDVNKFDGSNIRTLYGHEYSQMSGRAGRRGIDTVGHVIHLNNLFRDIDNISYKTMMNGKPQVLTSKFKISYNLLLNLTDIGQQNLTQFAGRSMITSELDEQMKQLYNKISALQIELNNINGCMKLLRTPMEVLEEYSTLSTNKHFLVNKKRREIERKIQSLLDNHKFLRQDLESYYKISAKEKEINQLKTQYNTLQEYFKKGVDDVLNLLTEEKYVQNNQLTLEGKIASQIREVHCLIFTQLYMSHKLDALSSKQLVALFSCFTALKVSDDFKENVPKSKDIIVNQIINEIVTAYDNYQNKELARNINTGFDYEIHYDLLNYVEEWCCSESIEDCKLLLQKMAGEKEIFLGEYVKALLKINNIASEFEKIAELSGNIEFLAKLREIPNMTLKYVVTNQSLYV